MNPLSAIKTMGKEKEGQKQDHEGVPLKGQLKTPQTRIQPTTAGRELDALIAEKVMGAVWLPVPEDMKFRESEWLQIPKPEVPGKITTIPILGQRFPDGRVNTAQNCPHYSTSIADAWSVVEAMEGRRFTSGRLIEEWDWRIDQVQLPFLAGRHAAEAICLAALAALASISPSTQEDGT